ncbi:MAG TPA: hypothetical protein VGY56_21900 [Verrucomicrobiae bacterium]|nr:hypothetical protein [Verrucomicrobiae bacterium]
MAAAVANTQTTLETTVPDRPAVPDVLHEHIHEIAYLSIQRRKLLFSQDIPLRRLRTHAGRIEAHLDGLRIGVPASVNIANGMLDGDDPWFISAALRIWVEIGQPQPAIVHQRLAAVAPELSGSCKEAFRQLPAGAVERIFPDQPGATPDSLLELAIDARGWHGLIRPETAARLAGSAVTGIRRALARHASQHDLISKLLTDGDQLVRRMALWSMAKQDSRATLDQSRQLAAGIEPDAFALRLIGLLGEYADGSRLLPFLRQKSLAPSALLALRDLAYPALAESVVDVIDSGDSEIAPLAKAVFESLTGQIPEPNPEKLLPQGISPARSHWQDVRKHHDASRRSLSDRPFPWQGPAVDEPMLWVWRRSLTTNPADLAWLRREVPDGFFSGLDSEEAIPGE